MRPRNWLQFHLSTALLTTLAAGGLLYANLRPYVMEEFSGSTSYEGKIYSNHVLIEGRGWPLTAVRHFIYGVPEIPHGYYWDRKALIADILVALLILGAFILTVEGFIGARQHGKSSGSRRDLL